MSKTKLISAVAGISLAVVTLAGGSATAADGKDLYTAKTCNACHGPDAQTPIMPNYPKLAGQNAQYAVQQMKDIKSGARANGQSGAMKPIMAMVNEDEMNAIGEWLSSLK